MRLATTVTLYRMDAMEANDDDLIEQLQQERARDAWSPLVEPRVEYINWRKQGFGGEPGSVCFGLSWRNVR